MSLASQQKVTKRRTDVTQALDSLYLCSFSCILKQSACPPVSQWNTREGASVRKAERTRSPGDPLSFPCAPMSHDPSPIHPKTSQYSLKLLTTSASFPPGGPFWGCGSLSTSSQYNITRRVALLIISILQEAACPSRTAGEWLLWLGSQMLPNGHVTGLAVVSLWHNERAENYHFSDFG